LALFGRRLPQRVDRPASRRPKTSTNCDIADASRSIKPPEGGSTIHSI